MDTFTPSNLIRLCEPLHNRLLGLLLINGILISQEDILVGAFEQVSLEHSISI